MSLAFAQPWVLVLLVVPLFMLWWQWRPQRPGDVVLPLDHRSERRAWYSGLRILGSLISLAQSLPALLLAAAILLLANPLAFTEPKFRRSLTNIEFCLDVSGSMTADFGGEGTRYDGAMRAINEFVERREGDAFGLTIFGNEVLHWVPLTSDPSAIRCATPFLRPENLPGWFGGTEIGKALLACGRVLDTRDEGDRMIILVSDGVSSDLGGGRDDEIARRLRSKGIEVYAIHVADGPPPGELTTITTNTGGEVFAAGDPGSLLAVFARIDDMQKTELEKLASESQDDFAPTGWFVLTVLLTFLLAQFGLRFTPW